MFGISYLTSFSSFLSYLQCLSPPFFSFNFVLPYYPLFIPLFLSFSLSLSIPLFIPLSLSIYLSFSLSLYLSLSLSFFLSISLSHSLSHFLSLIHRELPYEFGPRREGDISTCYADPNKYVTNILHFELLFL